MEPPQGKLMHRVERSIEPRDFSITSSSKRCNSEQNARSFRAATRKAFACCEINFSLEMPVIIILSYLDAFYRRKIKRSEPWQFDNFIHDISLRAFDLIQEKKKIQTSTSKISRGRRNQQRNEMYIIVSINSKNSKILCN